jgi:outer membrane protein assembly complex protein YaeT
MRPLPSRQQFAILQRIRAGNDFRSIAGWIAALLILLIPGALGAVESGPAEQQKPPPPAKVRVRGLGLLENRINVRTIRRIWPEKKFPPTLPAGFAEDAALLLRSKLVEQGFLKARVTLELIDAAGQSTNLVCGDNPDFFLPADLELREITLRAERGLRYYFKELEFENLDVIQPTRARGFFHPTDSIIPLRSERPYNPAQFARSRRNLELEFAHQGYRNATTEITRLDIDDATGQVRATLKVDAGLIHRVRKLEIEIRDTGEGPLISETRRQPDVPWSFLWNQETAEELKQEQFAQGYADATVTLNPVRDERQDDTVWVDLKATVVRGPRIRLGNIEFEGQQKTREWMLRRKARLSGPWLNRVEADEARNNLSRLGVFKSVYVDYPEATNHVRNVRYTLEEGKRIDIRLLMGYGDYDMAFGGVEIDQFNLWGLGHHARLYGVQSFKSTIGRYTYSVPEFLAPDLTAFADADFLRREELTFERREIKLGAGLRKSFPSTGQQVGLRYSYQFLRSDQQSLGTEVENTRVAAVVADWSIERRNNPLLPRRGFRAGFTAEFATPELGGEASYQRIEGSFSYHLPVARATYLHFGIWHGIAADLVNDNGPLPFNKRFFPGGETSIRGYQQGGASPLDPIGRQLGAESGVIGNFELEQALTRRWSLVGFVDAGGVTPTIDEYPFDETLVSIGGGIRWNTPVGPLRVEYGHNLNRRQFDPSGTWHFSLGYPF